MDYAMSRDQVALFMEMRLGKSLVSIRWAASRAKRILLIAPRTTLLGKTQWEGEITREGHQAYSLPRIPKKEWPQVLWHWRKKIVTAPEGYDDGFARAGDTVSGLVRRYRPGWFLLNPEALIYQPDLLLQKWDAIIVDESTRIRNPKAQITKLLLRDSWHIPYRAMLTGLPNPESSMDYFCQFVFLRGEFMGMDNYWAWRQRYFHQGVPQWNWRPNPGTRDAIMRYVQEHAFVLQRKEAGVGSNKIRQQVRVPMTPTQKLAMKSMRREYALAGTETKWATVLHTWAQKLAGGWHPTLDPPVLLSDAKLVALAKICRRIKPVVVWFRFNHEIEAAYHYLIQHVKGLRVAYVHGAMKDSKTIRIDRQEAFQDGKLDCLLLQVKLGKYGWNLSRSNTAVYYSNTYEFEDRSQSEDRIIHLEKKDDCLYIDLVTIGSTDEDLVDSLSEKRITARQFARRINDSIKKMLRSINAKSLKNDRGRSRTAGHRHSLLERLDKKHRTGMGSSRQAARREDKGLGTARRLVIRRSALRDRSAPKQRTLFEL